MEKRKSHAFGKDVYLLGTIDGELHWLEAPSWDCGWYWGFGYVETYTSKEPSTARDINSHSHIGSMLRDAKVHNIFKLFNEATFTEDEGWKLSELFKQFYLLKEMAEFYHRGGAHVANSPVDWSEYNGREKEINEIMLPKVFEAIISILSPIGEPT